MPPTSPPSEEEEFWLFGYGSLIWKPPPHYDRRVPGYIKGYIRRFWQVRPPSPLIPPHAGSHREKKSDDHRGTPARPGRVATLIEHGYWNEHLRDKDEDGDLGPEKNPSCPPVVWGAAYRIPGPYVETVKKYLDIREINGYSIQHADFHPAAPPSAPPTTTTTTAITTTATAAAAAPPTTMLPTSSSPSSTQPQTAAETQPIIIKNTLLYIGLPTNPNFLGALHPGEVSAVIAAGKGPSGENAEYLFMLEDALESLGPGSGDRHVSGLSARVRALLLLEGKKLGHQKGDDIEDKDHGLNGMIKKSGEDEITTDDTQAETEKP